MIGAQRARVEVLPDGLPHPRWSEVEDYIARTGTALDVWQARVFESSLRMAGDLYAAFSVGVCAPRQNGKNGITEMRELVGAHLLGESMVIHTAHLADTSKEAFRRLEGIIDENDWLSRDVKHIWRTNGHEAIEFSNGCRIRFRTRTRGGGRGFSAPVVIFDEAMFLPTVSLGAMLPLVSAQPNPQIWFVGSAVDQTVMEDGVEFARVRENATATGGQRVAYFEWSLPYDTPDQVPDVLDMDAVAESNPAFGIRLSAEYVEVEHGALDQRTHAVERYGVGDWPDTDGAVDLLINLARWNELERDTELLDPVCVAFDVAPDRRSSVVLAGINDLGCLHVELFRTGAGSGWLVEAVKDLYEEREVSEIVCDGYGPAGAVAQLVDEAGITVRRLDSNDYGQACGFLVDQVMEGDVQHSGQPEFVAAIRGAKARPLVDRWAWSRTKSTVDISPLVAATLAHWSAVENAVGEVHIY